MLLFSHIFFLHLLILFSWKEQEVGEEALYVGVAAQVKNDNASKDEESGEYTVLNSFTRLLTGPVNDDLLAEELF